jgi:hypothetical protein
MATITRPTFPDPALEVGVAQYPTPLVPDYYTKTGHIILVEKVSIEKGTYNPQPLDGSVTYTGRDANDWPSTLYLVFQQTEPTGKFVFNYWANDRTLASQDPWNYGLEYSLNHPSYKIITRTYITPRATYSPVALGSVDPVFGGTAIVAQQKMVELPDDNPLRSRYVQVQRVYETIPSSVITGKVMSEFGIATATKQVVVAGTAIPAIGETTISSQISAVDAVKSTLDKVEYDSTEVLDGYQYDPDLNLVVHTTKEIIAEGASPLSFSNGLLSYRDEPINAWKSIRIQSRIASLPAGRTEYKTGAYASPNLLYGFNVFAPQLPNWDINVSVTPIMRAKRSYQTVFKHITSYVYGNPDPEPSAYTIYDPVSINVYYDGYFFKINITDALTDAGFPISFTTASNDPIHGYVNETYTVPTSTESASSYLSKVGTYQLVAYEIDYWKANIWRVSEQWVLLK